MGKEAAIGKKINSAITDLFNVTLPKKLKQFKLWCKIKFDYILHSPTWRLAGILLAIAFFCFISTYLTNLFTIPLGGDYVLQEIPFIYNGYDDWKHFFATGEFVLWDTSGFLGVNNIGANQFYYLTSPWFLIYLLFPRNILSQVQGILTMFKLMTAGLLFYKYLDSFSLREGTRKLGAMAYAFCGWMFYNLWFHFIDAAVFLPLLLLGFEKVFQKKGPLCLILGLILLGFTNFFFLASFCLASVPYVIFRVIQICSKGKIRDIGRIFVDGVIGTFLGLAIVSVVLLPSVFSTMQMPRVSNNGFSFDFSKFIIDKKYDGIVPFLNLIFKNIKQLLQFNKPYEAIYPLTSFYFMNITCFSTNLFRNYSYNNTMSSIFVFTPFILMLVPSVINSFRTKKISHIIGFFGVVFMLFTPFFYYFFHAFTITYGRWELMAVCWMLVFFCIHYDQRGKMPKYYMDISLGFTLAMMGLGGVLANVIQNEHPNDFAPADGRNALIPLQIVYTIVCYFVMRLNFRKKKLTGILTWMVALEAIVQGNVTIYIQGVQKYQELAGGLTNLREERGIANALKQADDSFYRVYTSTADRGANNIQMQIGYNGISTFNSTYAFKADDLIEWSKVNYNRSWSMSVNEKRNNLEALLGVKYYVLKEDDINVPYGYKNILKLTVDEAESLGMKTNKLEQLQKKMKESYTDHKLYVNMNYIHNFFVYDEVVSSNFMHPANYYFSNENENEVVYLKYAIVDNKELEELKENDGETYQRLNGGIDPEVGGSIKLSSTYIANEGYKIKQATLKSYKIRIPDWNEEGHINGWPDQGVPEYGTIETDKEYDYKEYITMKDEKGNYLKIPYWSRIYMEPSTPICPNAVKGDQSKSCFVSVNAKYGYNVDYYLLNKDGKMITHDDFYWNGYSKDYDWKYARGFYTDEPVYKVVGFIKEDIPVGGMLGGLYKYDGGYFEVTSNIPSVSYIENSDYQKAIDKLKDNGKNIELVKQSANDIYFKTTFNDPNDKLHFTVINQPIDDGWTLKRKYEKKVCDEENNCTTEKISENVKLYKAQGGLIGFEAINSETPVDYELTYCPRGLKTGGKLTIVGLLCSLLVVYFYMGKHLIDNTLPKGLFKKYTLKKSPYDKEVWLKMKKAKNRKLRR